jgi:hypothetical protein
MTLNQAALSEDERGLSMRHFTVLLSIDGSAG